MPLDILFTYSISGHALKHYGESKYIKPTLKSWVAFLWAMFSETLICSSKKDSQQTEHNYQKSMQGSLVFEDIFFTTVRKNKCSRYSRYFDFYPCSSHYTWVSKDDLKSSNNKGERRNRLKKNSEQAVSITSSIPHLHRIKYSQIDL